MKLSRKRPAQESESDKSKKTGQTKISKFFSKSILASKEKEKEKEQPKIIVEEKEEEIRFLKLSSRVTNTYTRLGTLIWPSVKY